MYDINVRGTFFVVKACISHLKKSANPHILTLSPPINLDSKMVDKHVAYTVTKYSMSMMTMGWAKELSKDRNSRQCAMAKKQPLDTAAVRNLLGGTMLANMSRTPEILADAAYYILRQASGECTGNYLLMNRSWPKKHYRS